MSLGAPHCHPIMAEAGEPVGLRRLGRPGCGKLQPPGKWFTNAALAIRPPSLGPAGEAVWLPQTASFAAPDGPFRGAGRPPSASGWPSGRWQGGAGEGGAGEISLQRAGAWRYYKCVAWRWWLRFPRSGGCGYGVLCKSSCGIFEVVFVVISTCIHLCSHVLAGLRPASILVRVFNPRMACYGGFPGSQTRPRMLAG